jgi:hypothetical protein
VALQQSTREIWAATGPFEQYPISRQPQRNVPSAFLEEAVWQVINRVECYYAKSHTPEESGLSSWYPVEFNFKQVCWVEVHWVEPVAGEGYWQAFHIAGEDLHLDITPAELAEQDQVYSRTMSMVGSCSHGIQRISQQHPNVKGQYAIKQGQCHPNSPITTSTRKS